MSCPQLGQRVYTPGGWPEGSIKFLLGDGDGSMDLFGALPGLLQPLNWLYYAPISIAILASTALLAGWLKLKKGVKVNYTRKVFHILNFTYANAAWASAELLSSCTANRA